MEKFCDVILVTFFGDVDVITSLKWRHNLVARKCFLNRGKIFNTSFVLTKNYQDLHQPDIFNWSVLYLHIV